jgi:hypothetical protein
MCTGGCSLLAVPPEKRQGGFVPYRDNLLTRVMEDSLGGNVRSLARVASASRAAPMMTRGCQAKTLMFVNISPSASEFNESNGSLTYAQMVNSVSGPADAGPPHAAAGVTAEWRRSRTTRRPRPSPRRLRG